MKKLGFSALILLAFSTGTAKATSMAEDLLDAARFSIANNDAAKAMEQINKAVKLEPANQNAVGALLQLQMFLGKLTDAEKTWTAFQRVNKNKNLAPLLLNLRANLLIAEGKTDQALAVYESLLKKEPNNTSALLRTATALATKGNAQEAFKRVEQVLKLEPKNVEAWYSRGILLASSGQVDEAIAALRQAVALRPDFKEANASLADLYQALSSAFRQKAGGQPTPSAPSP